MSNRDQKDQEQFEVMYIPMNKKWSAEELDGFIDSVNTIYNSFYILDMISNNNIHEKVIDIALTQMERYRAIEPLPQWIELRDSMEAAYSALPISGSGSMKTMFTREIFRILEQYVNTADKLSINWIEYSSPGGIEFKAPKPISRSKTDIPEPSPLARTQKFIEEASVLSGMRQARTYNFDDVLRDLETKLDSIVREFMVENKIIDPEIMQMIKEVAVSGALENLRKLEILDKISLPKMVSKNYGVKKR